MVYKKIKIKCLHATCYLLSRGGGGGGGDSYNPAVVMSCYSLATNVYSCVIFAAVLDRISRAKLHKQTLRISIAQEIGRTLIVVPFP